MWLRFKGADTRIGAFRFDGFRADSPQQKSVLAGALQYAETIHERRKAAEGAVFYGPPGSGKTHLCTAIVREGIAKHGFSAHRIVGPVWYSSLRDLIGNGGRTEASELDRLRSCDLLLIDDPLPPVGRLTEFQSAMLFAVADGRRGRGNPTLITVNVSGRDEAIERAGAAVWDRLIDHCWVFACHFPSARKPARIFGAANQ